MLIESLHSPHVARVKALIGSKGAQERRARGLFVAEGVQAAREALGSSQGPKVVTLYYTQEGAARISDLDFSGIDSFEVTDAVMKAMTSTVTPQGVIALCAIPSESFEDFVPVSAHPTLIYLHEIQDPGNAGTILRTADATGVTAVITSPRSVDFYSPKVVRSTAGSLWNIPLFQGVEFDRVLAAFPQSRPILLSSHANTSLVDLDTSLSYIAIFGNEARGVRIDELATDTTITEITIPMAGSAESLNLSAAASIVMFQLSQGHAG